MSPAQGDRRSSSDELLGAEAAAFFSSTVNGGRHRWRSPDGGEMLRICSVGSTSVTARQAENSDVPQPFETVPVTTEPGSSDSGRTIENGGVAGGIGVHGCRADPIAPSP